MAFILGFVCWWYYLPFNAIKSKYKAIQKPQQENDTQCNGGYIMNFLRIIKDNIITTETTRTRSGVVWMLPGFCGRFKGVLRRFYCLGYIYTILLFQWLILANRGLKLVYIKTLCNQDNAQPQTIQDTPKKMEKYQKSVIFIKNIG